MTKYILSIFFCLSLLSTKASHLMGGEITVSVDSNNNAYFLLKLYRDVNGIGLPGSANLSVSAPNGSNFTVALNRSKTSLIQGAYPSEANFYEGNVQLMQNGMFTAVYSTCCRNGSIVNLGNPGSDAFYVSTTFSSFQSNTNSTPVFLNLPVITFPIDSIWTYNPMPFDAEGDSLFWQIDTPMAAAGQHVNGYTTPTANANGPLSMDPQTGVISWSADQLGNYQIAVIVREFRNGQPIGSIIRDMQVTVTNDTSAMSLSVPAISNPNSPVSILANDPYSLDFDLSVADTSVNLSLEASGEAFELNGTNAKFVVTKLATKTISGKFTWTPTPNDVRDEPYVLVVRASDENFTYDYTVQLLVPSSVNLPKLINQGRGLVLYPNPTDGKFTMNTRGIVPGIYTISIRDITGSEVYRGPSQTWFNGKSTSLEGLSLRKGQYMIRLEGEVNVYQNKLIIK